MARTERDQASRAQEPPAATQQELDPIGGGDRAAAEAFRQPGQGNASHTAANPPAGETDTPTRNNVDPRASPPFAKG
jgi:hypothetical protein